jgi:cytoskeletal protein CcmA (bactofilin family)
MCFFVFIFCVVTMLPVVSYADQGPIIRGGESISVDAQKILEGDFYGFGGTVIVSGNAKHDSYLGGGSVTVNGPVEGDLSVIGGDVQIHAAVGDDVRVIAGNVIVAGQVNGDLVVVAGSVHVLSTAVIKGSIVFTAQDVLIDGSVDGSVYGKATSLRIDAPVKGGVSTQVYEQFVLGDHAIIDGTISYKSPQDLIRAQNTTIHGDIHKENMLTHDTTKDFVRKVFFESSVLLFASLLLFLVARARMIEVSHLVSISYGRQGLIGLGMFLSMSVITLILMMSVLGLLFGVFAGLLYGTLIAMSFMVIPIIVGAFITQKVLKQPTMSALSVVIGVVGVGLLSMIPILGLITLIVLFFVSFGTLCTVAYRRIR